MILDTHSNLRKYAPLFCGVDPGPLFDWLEGCGAAAPGTKVEFAGDKLFAKTMTLETGGRDKFRWETHREYIDLQFITGGGEIIEWTPADKLVPDGDYDTATDLQFYSPAAADALVPSAGGKFVFLFPSDAHKPLVSDGMHGEVRKAIAKIHRSLLLVQGLAVRGCC